MVKSNLTQDFYLGNHGNIAEKLLNARGPSLRKNLPLLVGSLSFLGRIAEAENIYKEHVASLQSWESAACRFYLGVGLCRESSYEEGRAYFVKNLVEFRSHQSPHIQFYVFQGVGFYRYLQCRYQTAATWALRSLIAANRARFVHGRYLASDLLGYTQVLSGKISEGLKSLEDSKQLAQSLGTGTWQRAAETAILCYEAQFGLKPKTILLELDRLYSKLTADLAYLQSSLLLEKARQLTLRGRIMESDAVLHEACRLIYASKHKRHGVLLNLRLSENRFFQENYYEALNLIRSTTTDLDLKIDKQLSLSVLGMEKKICQKLQLPFSDANIEKLTLRFGTSVAKSMLRREKNSFENIPNEDMISKLLTSTQQAPMDCAESLFDSGYLGLLLPLLPKRSARNEIFVDLSPKWILIVENGSLRVRPRNHSPQLDHLLRILSCGEISRADLVHQLWGYSYHPLRHDPLLYRAFGRLKAFLGLSSALVETTKEGYRVPTDFSVTFVNQRTPAPKRVPSKNTNERLSMSSLNHRQMGILQILKKQRVLGVKEVEREFKVSNMTACRDLSALCRRGLIVSRGRARATRYCLPDQ